MNWDDLRVATAVYETGSFAAAAARLRINETTVARRLSRLQEDLGVTLFEAMDGARTPTPECQELVALAARMVVLIGAGLAQVFETYPISYQVLKVVSIAYLLYLAWKIATAAPPGEAEQAGTPLTFLQAALFQWVNPKAWAMVIRTLMRIQKVGDLYVSRHIERIPKSSAVVNFPVTFKYDGIVLYMSGRLFVVEHESILDSTICELILAPVIRPGSRLLSGVQCSLTTGTGTEPTSTRIVVEYLGRNINLRNAMSDAVNLLPGAPVSYGKAAIVGVAGDMEHGGAVIHPKLGKPMRSAVGGGKALIPSNVKVAAAGVPLDLPLGHKDEAWSFDHFDTMGTPVQDPAQVPEKAAFSGATVSPGDRTSMSSGKTTSSKFSPPSRK